MREGFYEEEMICGYTVSADMKHRWGVSLDLLERFMAVCDKHKLRYYAVFGTLLGAVRHSGFIPWDDDIDIAMMREDFEALEKIAADEFAYPYFLQTVRSDPLHFVGVARLRNSDTTHLDWNERFQRGNKGCFIDIIVFDPLCESSLMRSWQRNLAVFCRQMLAAKLTYYDHYYYCIPQKMKAPFIVSKLFSRRRLAKWFESACKCCRSDSSRYVGAPAGSRYFCFDRDIFNNTVMVTFEHLQLPAPSGYERFAEIVWGGMGLPEDSERSPHHGGIVDIDIPYTDVRNRRFTDVFRDISDKTILLFGAGNVARLFIKHHGKRFMPECLFDNDPNKWGTERHGVLVRNPAELPDAFGDNVRLIIASIYYKEIGKQLEEMGITDYYIYLEAKKYEKM